MIRLAFLFSLVALPAWAQMVCGERGKMTGHLDKTYQESRSALGLSASGAVVELFTADSGTWTILVTRPGGPTCVIASGEGWEQRRRLAPKS